MYESFSCYTALLTFAIIYPFHFSHSGGWRQYYIEVLICISWWLMKLSTFLPLGYHLLWRIFSSLFLLCLRVISLPSFYPFRSRSKRETGMRKNWLKVTSACQTLCRLISFTLCDILIISYHFTDPFTFYKRNEVSDILPDTILGSGDTMKLMIKMVPPEALAVGDSQVKGRCSVSCGHNKSGSEC